MRNTLVCGCVCARTNECFGDWKRNKWGRGKGKYITLILWIPLRKLTNRNLPCGFNQSIIYSILFYFCSGSFVDKRTPGNNKTEFSFLIVLDCWIVSRLLHLYIDQKHLICLQCYNTLTQVLFVTWLLHFYFKFSIICHVNMYHEMLHLYAKCIELSL